MFLDLHILGKLEEEKNISSIFNFITDKLVKELTSEGKISQISINTLLELDTSLRNKTDPVKHIFASYTKQACTTK